MRSVRDICNWFVQPRLWTNRMTHWSDFDSGKEISFWRTALSTESRLLSTITQQKWCARFLTSLFISPQSIPYPVPFKILSFFGNETLGSLKTIYLDEDVRVSQGNKVRKNFHINWRHSDTRRLGVLLCVQASGDAPHWWKWKRWRGGRNFLSKTILIY